MPLGNIPGPLARSHVITKPLASLNIFGLTKTRLEDNGVGHSISHLLVNIVYRPHRHITCREEALPIRSTWH